MSQFDQAAPSLMVDQWIQGDPTNIDQEQGNVILVEVFQVNCPGCFLYGLPAAIEIYQKFKGQALCVLGLATAFEDFDKNNLENLKKLVFDGEVVGETLNTMSSREMLHGNRLQYSIPFPIAWDQVVDFRADVEETVRKMIHRTSPTSTTSLRKVNPLFPIKSETMLKIKPEPHELLNLMPCRGHPLLS